MTDLRKAAEMALEMLVKYDGDNTIQHYVGIRDSITALRQALAQPEQKPVVHPVVHLWDCICEWVEMVANEGKDANLTPPDWLVDAVKAATAPPKREWVGLTDAEFMTIERKYSLSTRVGLEYFKDELEAKLKEKNT